MAVAITQTCNDCGNYSVRNGACLEWRAPVEPGDICQRFIAADGSGRLRAVEDKAKEPEVEPMAKNSGTGRRTGGKPEAPEAPTKVGSPAEESELHQIGEWILDFDARLRKMETRLADGLEGIADKLGAMQGSMIALRQAHIVTSQSVGGIKEQLEQTRPAGPDYTDRLLGILETQQAIMADMARGRDDADQS